MIRQTFCVGTPQQNRRVEQKHRHILSYKSPYEIIFGKTPRYSAIKKSGCLAYAHNQKQHGDKFASRNRRCVIFGYPYAKKG